MRGEQPLLASLLNFSVFGDLGGAGQWAQPTKCLVIISVVYCYILTEPLLFIDSVALFLTFLVELAFPSLVLLT